MNERGSWLLAGWWPRVAASLIDFALLVLGAGVIVGLSALVFLVGAEAGAVSVILGLLVAAVAFTVASLLYPPAMMAATNGQTVGKRLCRIRVVRVDGQPMDFGWAALREAAIKWLGFGVVGASATFGLAPLVDVLWPLWDDEHRALHDFLARTRVVRA